MNQRTSNPFETSFYLPVGQLPKGRTDQRMVSSEASKPSSFETRRGQRRRRSPPPINDRTRRGGQRWSLGGGIFWLLLWLTAVVTMINMGSVAAMDPPDGPTSLAKGRQLFETGQYEQAAEELWKAVLLHGNTPDHLKYDVQTAFQMFMQCYALQGKLVEGFAFVAAESFRRGQMDMGRQYLQQARSADPHNPAVRAVLEEYPFANEESDPSGSQHQEQNPSSSEDDPRKKKRELKILLRKSRTNALGSQGNDDLLGKTPEQLYEVASQHFSDKNYEECADIFEISCQRSGYKLGPSCVNAVYCRNLLSDYGYNGTQFQADMDRIVHWTEQETLQFRQGDGQTFSWKRATSVHPHMMLGYPIDPMLKRYVAESVAYLDEQMARAHDMQNGELPPLPNDMPFDLEQARQSFLQESSEDNFRIRVGFVGSGFNSKAVLYLSQDMFRFFDTSKFEIHIFSFGPPDNDLFIRHGMRGVDWRERVKANVDFFHDCQAMKMDHVKAARFIHDQRIHILIEWDGYARQGERAQGLLALRPAPIQMLHQEYLGTSGARYVDYLFTDLISSPPETQDLYTEKLIYMPNHFFSKGHAYQKEVKKPRHKYVGKKGDVYKLGQGSPRQNRCMAPADVGPAKPSFVFCSFNKLLKANPQTFRSWINILRKVPDSMLCLLENPKEAVPYVRRFVHEAAGTRKNGTDSFVPGDGDDLNSRIHFLAWEKNPFDHQMRNQDFCNVMLDSHPYNGHTVAQDALYGGVPIVTRSDGDDMSSRVTTSANIVLGLEGLNAHGGHTNYEEIAVYIATNITYYKQLRSKLIDSCLQRNPMHPYWDVARYVKNFEVGLGMAWKNFLEGTSPHHIHITEPEAASKGTFDDEILAHPSEGRGKHYLKSN